MPRGGARNLSDEQRAAHSKAVSLANKTRAVKAKIDSLQAERELQAAKFFAVLEPVRVDEQDP
jgi:hypothetical protein